MKLWPLLCCLVLAACAGGTKNLETKTSPSHKQQSADHKKAASGTKPKNKLTSGDKPQASKKKKKTAKKKKRWGKKSKRKAARAQKPSGKLQGREFNRYAGKLKRFFYRFWKVPSALEDPELMELKTVVRLRFDSDFKITGYGINRKSGHESFDDSVHLGLEAVINRREEQPAPTEAIRDRVLKSGVLITIKGQDAIMDW